jgi:hypothetical protein
MKDSHARRQCSMDGGAGNLKAIYMAYWAGGDNLGAFRYPVQIPSVTLTVDGTPFVMQGKVVIPVARAVD